MADYQYINQTGLIVPDTEDVLGEVQQEYRDVFGQDLVVAPSTPQGALIVAETTARTDVVRNNAALANQINPNQAGGIFLEAIAALTGLAREPGEPSTLSAVNLTGQPGTIIPAGSRASLGIDGLQFESLAQVTLDLLGMATVDFQAVEDGPVAVNIGDLDTVVSAVLGWETASNPTAATLGKLEESDIAFRRRRGVTLALQGSGGPEAIISALYNTEGVKSLTFRENVTDATEVIDGVSLVEHSIYVCVDGGTDQDIAATLVDSKSSGSDYNGDQVVDYVEPVSGQTYEVKFDRPDLVAILARVTVKVSGATADPDVLVRTALLAYVNGEIEGESGFTVGTSVSPFELAGAINIMSPGLYVQKVEIRKQASGSYAVDEIPIEIFEKATLSDGGITVIVA
jgi:uncharacterized phage protein gp47/JayE